jgi:DGQHR domain-containing protein
MSTVGESTNLQAKSTIRLEGTVFVQRGRPMLMAALPARDVVRHKTVDTYDPYTKKGYQRSPSPTRIASAARYYGEKDGHMPNPLLVNIREEDFGRVDLVVTSDHKEFELARANGGDWIGHGYVEIPTDLPIHLYDGQHRAGGLETVLSDYEGFEDFPIPLSVSLGLDELDEMTEFYEVNTNAKSVRTDLAWQLLKEMADKDPELAERLEMEGKDWVTRGIAVVEELMKLPGPWKDRIQAPNEKVRRSDNLTIPQAQFVRSLRPILDMPLMAKADPDKIAQLLNAYWQGIASVLPEPFLPGTNPKEYAIQKGQGAVALHRLLPQAIETVRSRGEALNDPAAYAEVMKSLPKLSGEVVTDQGMVPVSGADFWKSGSEGVASQFTGDAGRKRLSVVIRQLMPKPAEELNF